MSPEQLITNPKIALLASSGWQDYELLDTGGGLKLERYGPYTFVRPEPEAVWSPTLPEKQWRSATAVFQTTSEEHGGHWKYNIDVPQRWPMQYRGLKFWAGTSASRHMGVFPEQAAHWDWMQDRIAAAHRPVNVLNLFGYTGIATLAAAQAGAHVTHVDAAKKAITGGRENQALSGLEGKPIRWIVDDAIKFVLREGRRGAKYDGIVLDPPKFGRGPKGEVWEFYKLIPNLLQACRAILADRPLFVVLTAYAIKASSLTLYFGMRDMMSGLEGEITSGEVVTIERSAGRIISNAIFARWAGS